MTEPERIQSHAYSVLRASARRVLRLVESEITRQGGCATIYTDQFEHCGSRRVYRPALAEIHALGLAELERYPKRYVCRPSRRWLTISSRQDALTASTLGRPHCYDVETPTPAAVGRPPVPRTLRRSA